jgi:hypothetical protein
MLSGALSGRSIPFHDADTYIGGGCLGADGDETASHVLGLADVACVGEFVDFGNVDHPPTPTCAGFGR